MNIFKFCIWILNKISRHRPIFYRSFVAFKSPVSFLVWMFLDALQQKIRIWPNKQTRWVETALLFLSSDCDLNTLSSFELLNYLLTTQTETYNVSRQRIIVKCCFFTYTYELFINQRGWIITGGCLLMRRSSSFICCLG